MTSTSIFKRNLDPNLADTGTVQAPPRPEDISRRVGIPVEDLVRLSANEAPLGPSPAVREALAAASQSDVLHRYPNRTYRALTERLADFVGVDREQILPTAGASEVLPLALRAFCPPGSRVAYVHPGIPRVGREASQRGLEPHRVTLPWPYEMSAAAILGQVPVDTRLLFITSPNNTTSRLASPEDLALIAAGLPDTVIFVDEHYVEAAEDFRHRSAASLIGQADNVVVARTFSKVHAMAGLRAGYAVAPVDAVEAMRLVASRWPLSVPTEAAAIAALSDTEHFESTRSAIRAGRIQVVDALSGVANLELVPEPQGNFVLARTSFPPSRVMEMLWSHGVLINGFLLEGHIRMTIGTHDMNQRLIDALKATLSTLQSEGEPDEA